MGIAAHVLVDHPAWQQSRLPRGCILRYGENPIGDASDDP